MLQNEKSSHERQIEHDKKNNDDDIYVDHQINQEFFFSIFLAR